ncbi:MAG: hypothetical protein WC307_02145 [Candidatus Nanoarchaeia archaeon]|jgi:hypothetical protein
MFVLLSNFVIYQINTDNSTIIINNLEIKEFKDVITFNIDTTNNTFIDILACNRLSLSELEPITCIASYKGLVMNDSLNTYYGLIELFENDKSLSYMHRFNYLETNNSSGYFNFYGLTPLLANGSINKTASVQVYSRGEDVKVLGVKIPIENVSKDGVLITLNNQADQQHQFCIITDKNPICVNTFFYQNIIVYFQGFNFNIWFIAVIIIFLVSIKILSKKNKKFEKIPAYAILLLTTLSFICLIFDIKVANSIFIIVFYLFLMYAFINLFKF